MRPNFICTALTFIAIVLTGCTAPEPTEETVDAGQDTSNMAPLPPFKSVIPTSVLMRAIEMTAEEYWSSVSIVFDQDGEHQRQPETDEEWLQVWAAAIMLSEAGNTLMMPSHALDQGDWMAFAGDLVDAGLNAARAADARDVMAVLDEGGKVYEVCTACHEIYLPTAQL